MAIQLTQKQDGKLVEVRVSGNPTHEDYQHFAPEFEQLINKYGKLRMLFEMVDFHGWEGGALWDDIKFDLKHFSDIERLAMADDKKWEQGMSAVCRPFTTPNSATSIAPRLARRALGSKQPTKGNPAA